MKTLFVATAFLMISSATFASEEWSCQGICGLLDDNLSDAFVGPLKHILVSASGSTSVEAYKFAQLQCPTVSLTGPRHGVLVVQRVGNGGTFYEVATIINSCVKN